MYLLSRAYIFGVKGESRMKRTVLVSLCACLLLVLTCLPILQRATPVTRVPVHVPASLGVQSVPIEASSAAGPAAAISLPPDTRVLPIYSVNTEEKVCALGFNAAWDDDGVDEILAALEQAGVKATFFVLGEWAEAYPDRVRAMAAAGHEVMSHSYDHDDMTKMSDDACIEAIEKADSAIEALTDVPVDLFRVPSGSYNDLVIETLLSTGHYPIQWSVDSTDWKGLSAAEITAKVTRELHPGAIVLLHVGGEKHTAEALPALLEQMQAAGYTLQPVGEMIYRAPYSLDHEGRQSKIAESE